MQGARREHEDFVKERFLVGDDPTYICTYLQGPQIKKSQDNWRRWRVGIPKMLSPDESALQYQWQVHLPTILCTVQPAMQRFVSLKASSPRNESRERSHNALSTDRQS